MKIRSTTFRGPIYNSLSIANFRRIAQDLLTTKNLQAVAAPKKPAQAASEASVASQAKQSAKPTSK